jgi:hypothetical protein
MNPEHSPEPVLVNQLVQIHFLSSEVRMASHHSE